MAIPPRSGIGSLWIFLSLGISIILSLRAANLTIGVKRKVIRKEKMKRKNDLRGKGGRKT